MISLSDDEMMVLLDAAKPLQPRDSRPVLARRQRRVVEASRDRRRHRRPRRPRRAARVSRPAHGPQRRLEVRALTR